MRMWTDILWMVKQFLLHMWHMSYYPCYKPGNKSWMRKGPNCDYDKHNIFMVICDTDSITVYFLDVALDTWKLRSDYTYTWSTIYWTRWHYGVVRNQHFQFACMVYVISYSNSIEVIYFFLFWEIVHQFKFCLNGYTVLLIEIVYADCVLLIVKALWMDTGIQCIYKNYF